MFTPASAKTSDVSHAQDKFYFKQALDQLLTKFMFSMVLEPDNPLPMNSGLTGQWFRYDVPLANTTAAPEGEVGTGLTPTSTTITATLSEYRDFITISSVMNETMIDNVVMNLSQQLGYRAGLSVDTISRNAIDGTITNQAPLQADSTLVAQDIGRAVAQHQSNNIRPFSNGRFRGINHPLVTYDFGMADAAAAGFIDVQKHANPSDIFNRSDRGFVGTVHGCDMFESTNVTTLTSPTRYRTYIHGSGGYGKFTLRGKGPSDVRDPQTQRFSLIVHRANRGGIWDPEGAIPASIAYRFYYAVVVLDTATPRARKIDAQTNA